MVLQSLVRLQIPARAPAFFRITDPHAGRERRVIELAPGCWIIKYKPHSRILIAEPPRRVYPHPDWHAGAACAGMGDELFFGASPDERPTLKLSELARARAVCKGCPVAQACLTWAMDKPEKFGVWAGTSGRQRDRMRTAIDAGTDQELLIKAWLTR